MNYLAFWIALIVFGLIVIQFTVYQCRNPTYVVISTSINFIFSIILITALIHTGNLLSVFKCQHNLNPNKTNMILQQKTLKKVF